MCRKVEEDRLHVRFPFSERVSCMVLGENFQPPREVPAETEITDLSDHGVGIRLRGWTVKAGSMVVLRIRVLKTGTTVPTLAQVKWVKEGMLGASYAGLSFML